jgi:hypothetical protein
MSTWAWVAVAVGVVLILVLFVVTRPRNSQAELDRPAKRASAKQSATAGQLDRSGSLAQTPLRTLLVSLETNRATGTLTLTRGNQVCSLHMLFGHLFHASCGAAEGEQAVQEALSWMDGTYSFDDKSTLPTEETVTRPLDQVLAGGESLPAPVSPTRPAETVDWAGLLKRLEELADAALQARSRKVKEILQAAQPDRDAYIEAIDRIANMSVMFVDPARLTTLAGQMRRMLDEATG